MDDGPDEVGGEGFGDGDGDPARDAVGLGQLISEASLCCASDGMAAKQFSL